MQFNFKSTIKKASVQIFVLVLNIFYLFGGTFLFQLLESDNAKMICHELEHIDLINRNQIRQKLFQFTPNNSAGNYTDDSLKINTFIKDYVKNLQTNITNFNYYYIGFDCKVKDVWNFAQTLLYCVTIISTIGYGKIVPFTEKGKIIVLCYATLGIPLFLIFLSRLSQFFAFLIRQVFNACVKKTYSLLKKKDLKITPTVPLTVTLIIIFIYLLIGAGIFSRFETWPLVESIYFCFITLSTIGFGDLAPGQVVSDPEKYFKLITGSFYILLGLAVIATCFDLVQEELISKFKWIGQKLSLISENYES